jgi:hypothetical protein
MFYSSCFPISFLLEIQYWVSFINREQPLKQKRYLALSEESMWRHMTPGLVADPCSLSLSAEFSLVIREVASIKQQGPISFS